ncbi:MAG: hypothetical protein ACKO6N_04275 [Myxococcota bacterium]
MDPHLPLLLSLQSIARLERAGVRPPRLTEPGHESWKRIQRRLRWIDFIAILHQDLAIAFPYPFDLGRWQHHPLRGLPEHTAKHLLAQAMMLDPSDALTFLRASARALELPAGGAIAELPRVQPHQRVLELPGSHGRIAAYQLQQNATLTFHEQFTFVADSDPERLLVGLAAVELRAQEPRILSSHQVEDKLQELRIDRAFGLKESPAASALELRLKPLLQEVRLV